MTLARSRHHRRPPAAWPLHPAAHVTRAVAGRTAVERRTTLRPRTKPSLPAGGLTNRELGRRTRRRRLSLRARQGRANQSAMRRSLLRVLFGFVFTAVGVRGIALGGEFGVLSGRV